MTDEPTRTDVLDSIDDRTTDNPLADADRSPERSRGTASRRSVLAAAGAIGATALSGCINPFSDEPTRFEAELPLLPLAPLAERQGDLFWRELNRVHRVEASGELGQGPVSETVEIASVGATYRTVASPELVDRLAGATGTASGGSRIGPEGKPGVGETALFAVPKVDIGGQTIDLVGDLAARDLLGRLSRADDRPDEDGRVAKRFDLGEGVDDAASQLEHAYNGELAAVRDVSFLEWSPDSLQADGTLVFTARGETRGGYEGPIAGTLEHLEYDEGHVYKASWTPTHGDGGFARHLRETGGRIAGERLFPASKVEPTSVEYGGDGRIYLSACTLSSDAHNGYASYDGFMNSCHELRGYPHDWCQKRFLMTLNGWTWEETKRKCDQVILIDAITTVPGLTPQTPSGGGCSHTPPYCYAEDQIHL